MLKLNIPHHWEMLELGEYFTHVIGGDWGKAPDHNDVDDDFTEVMCIRGAEFRHWQENKGKTASLRAIKKSSLLSRKLEKNDLLVEISGGGPDQPVGRTVLVDSAALSHHSDTPKICTNFVRLARPVPSCHAVFLNYFLHFFYKSGEIKSIKQEVTT